MTETQEKQRAIAMATSGGVCQVCGLPLIQGKPQMAHRIADTKANRAKWGNWVIDHYLNVAMTCSLKCNDACNIGNNPGACLRLINEILLRETRHYLDS